MIGKRGFLFTVTIFLILTYILFSISVWVKSAEISERTYAEFYRESTLDLVLSQLSEEKITDVSDVLFRNALNRLNEHSVRSPVKVGAVEENEHIYLALEQLFTEGEASAIHFEGAALSDAPDSSFNDWIANFNSSLKGAGTMISDYSVSNFYVKQSAPDKLEYGFDLSISVSDLAGSSSLSREYSIRSNVSITGMIDAALLRASLFDGPDPIYRQYFFNEDYDSRTSFSPSRLAAAQEGQGWFYGPIATATSSDDPLVPSYSDVPPERRYLYVLVGSFEEIVSLAPSDYGSFGAYIVTSPPSTSPSVCPDKDDQSDVFNALKYAVDCSPSLGAPYTDKPYVVSNFNVEDAAECPLLFTEGNGKCVLLATEQAIDDVRSNPELKLRDGAIFNMERPRDFVMCGYYVKDPAAPSFLQRMFNNAYDYSDMEFGIDTFVIGNYANDYDAYNTNSRLSRELFTTPGVKIKGLPGCRTPYACEDSPITGIFAIGDPEEYGLDAVACNSGECD